MKNVLVGIVLIGVGAFGWWTLSPLFIDREVDDAFPVTVSIDSEVATDTNRDENIFTETNNEPLAVDEMPEAGVLGPFPIHDTKTHPATGSVYVVNSPEEVIIRYENYDGTNGPDLKVYLAKDLEANEYISLGAAKGNKGNINYGAPLDVDLSEYKYVLTWCEAFGVLFDYAEIN